MNKHIMPFLFPLMLLAACAPAVSPVPGPGGTPTPTLVLPVSTPPFQGTGQRLIVQSASYTIIVKDPAAGMQALQQAVEQAGGYVESASSWSAEDSSGYSSLNARIPPYALPALRQAVERIADTVQSQNFYVQDSTADYRKLQTRKQDLLKAQDQIWQLLMQSIDHDLDSTYKITRELLDHELESVEYQLDSYEQQAALASFDVTLNQTTAPVPTLE